MIRSGVIVFSLVAFLAGCQSSPPSLTPGDGAYSVSWHPLDGQAIAANTYFDLEATVAQRTSAGPPVDFAFDATMPAHRHGMNVIVTPELASDQTWVVRDVLLHMPGEWALDFDVTDADGVVHRAREVLIVR